MNHNIFYMSHQFLAGDEAVVKGGELRHIKNVLRKKRGEQIIFTDGQGYRYHAEIREVQKSMLVAKILKKQYQPRKFSLEIAVGFVPVKGLRNDLVIEKGTELGVAKFIVFFSEHAVVRNAGAQRLERFKKIAQSAMMQSQQFHLPQISCVPAIEDMLQLGKSYDCVVVADPQGKKEVPSGARKILLIIGPEGGFAEGETAMLVKNGAFLLNLGSTRLRSETAAIVGVSKILVGYGLI